MKIAVSTNNGGLDDVVSPVFARAPTFTIAEVESDKIKDVRVIQNPAAMAGGGAGIQAAQQLINEGVQAVIAGNFGPNAAGILAQAGISMISSPGTKVEEALKSVEGAAPTKQPSAPSTYQAPQYGYPVQPYGYGFGPGMGYGRGRGNRWMYHATGLPGWMRLGYSPGWLGVTPNGLPPYLQGYPAVPNPASTGVWPAAPTKEDEIKALEEQKKEIERRLKELRGEK